MKKAFIILTLFTFFIFPTYAAQIEKIPVEIVDNSDDSVGINLVYQIKELIRESNGMKLVESSDKYCIQVIISTLDRLPDSPNVSTIYSIIWNITLRPGNPDYHSVYNSVYYDNLLGYCGSSRVQETAEEIVAQTDKYIEIMKKDFKF